MSNSDNISPNEPDYKGRHLQQGINSFDTRRVSFYDGNQAYDLDLSIAKLVDGTYIAYAKRNLVPNNNLLQDIKKEKSMSKSQLASLDTDNISQQNINVNDKLSTKYSMQETKNNTPELENSSFSLEEKLEKYVYPQQVYENYKNEDKTKITETIDELKKYKETLDTNTNEGWYKNYVANQKIKALEEGFNNIYEYLVEREKNRIREEVKREI